MAALSNYLESGLLHHIFRGQDFPKPSAICIALTSGVPLDSQNGSTILEIALTMGGSGTGYSRINLGAPSSSGNASWSFDSLDFDAGSGLIKNVSNLVFTTALTDWGWVSGIAILDNATHGSGNLLMHSALDNPRIIYTGDGVKFDVATLQISFS